MARKHQKENEAPTLRAFFNSTNQLLEKKDKIAKTKNKIPQRKDVVPTDSKGMITFFSYRVYCILITEISHPKNSLEIVWHSGQLAWLLVHHSVVAENRMAYFSVWENINEKIVLQLEFILKTRLRYYVNEFCRFAKKK